MEIPLFPLPSLVLFPDVIVPLHIFEERYKTMVNACIENGEPFGLIQLRDGAQEETEQTIHRVGTTAHVIEVERLVGGRMNILCRGELRFRVARFLANEPVWNAEVNVFEDEFADSKSLAPLAAEVASLYRKAFALGIQLNAASPSELKLPDSPVELSCMVSFVLDIPPTEKQRLLEMRSTEERLRVLVEHVDQAISKLEQQLVHKALNRKVHGNGDLGKPGSHH